MLLWEPTFTPRSIETSTAWGQYNFRKAAANLAAVLAQQCPTDFPGTKRITLTRSPTHGESSESRSLPSSVRFCSNRSLDLRSFHLLISNSILARWGMSVQGDVIYVGTSRSVL